MSRHPENDPTLGAVWEQRSALKERRSSTGVCFMLHADRRPLLARHDHVGGGPT